MRIFIDCSHVDFTGQPTGIPRVVRQYVEEGYAWAAKSGVPVVPVVATAMGLVPVWPHPGRNPPDYLAAMAPAPAAISADNPSARDHVDAAAFHLQAALRELGAPTLARECYEAANTAFQTVLKTHAPSASHHAIAAGEGDVLFCPAYWHDVPPAHYQRLKARGVRIVTLVHDILPVTHARFYESPWKEAFAENLTQAIRHSDALFAVSHFTAASIREFAARRGLGDVEVAVSHNGFDRLGGPAFGAEIAAGRFSPLVRRRAAYDLLRDRAPFLMVGTLEPKKGHIPVIRSFEALWAAGLDRPLVIIGRKGWMEQPVVEVIENSPYFLDRLFWFDDFDDVDLAFAYHHARALVFGSYAEGFGIPMIEALSAGCPLIAYDTPVSREVAGEYGLFYEGFAAFAAHIVRLDGPAGQSQAKAAIAGFSWPAWPEVVAQLFERLATVPADVRQFAAAASG